MKKLSEESDKTARVTSTRME